MIKVDKEKCIGCGTCIAICSHNFALVDDGKAEVINQEIADCTKDAMESCPVDAISIG